jgi:magnesium transporter
MNPATTIATLIAKIVPFARLEESAGAVRKRLQGKRHDYVDLILVQTDDGRYAGAAELKDILAARDDERMSALVAKAIPSVPPDMTQEEAAEIAGEAGIAALPVVGTDGRPVGIVPPAALLTVLSREHHEDLHRLAGILHDSQNTRQALEDPPVRRAAHRLPWLLVGTVLSAAVTAQMAFFEHALARNVAIAFFIPALVYLAGAIGTQSETIAVRGLSTRTRPLARILGLEVIAGGLIGVTLGLVAFLGVSLAFGDYAIATGVAISLFAAGTLASAIGLLLPWLLSRMGVDPAFGSGPVSTVLQDGLTILIYFQVMAMALPEI